MQLDLEGIHARRDCYFEEHRLRAPHLRRLHAALAAAVIRVRIGAQQLLRLRVVERDINTRHCGLLFCLHIERNGHVARPGGERIEVFSFLIHALACDDI